MKQRYLVQIKQNDNKEWIASYDEYGITAKGDSEQSALDNIREKIIKDAIQSFDYEVSPVRRKNYDHALADDERVLVIDMREEIREHFAGMERMTITISRETRYMLSEYVDNYSQFFTKVADAYVKNRRKREREINTVEELIENVDRRVLNEFIKSVLNGNISQSLSNSHKMSFDFNNLFFNTPFRALDIAKPSNHTIKMICYREIGSPNPFTYAFAQFLNAGELLYQVLDVNYEENEFDFGPYRDEWRAEETGFYLVNFENEDDYIFGCSEGYQVISDKVINTENYETFWMDLPNPM